MIYGSNEWHFKLRIGFDGKKVNATYSSDPRLATRLMVGDVDVVPHRTDLRKNMT